MEEIVDSSNVVCVLGMHRSGTSLLMRLLNILGVELGPSERLQGATPANPTGYWEHREIRQVNDEILKRLGGSWRHPPAFPDQWALRAEFDDLRVQAIAIAERDFKRTDRWGFKDPRTCLTLAFWQGLFPQMRYVLCIRHPSEVALSVEHSPHVEYEGLTGSHALSLWSRYVAGSIVSTIGKHRSYVWYDDLIARPSEELHRLAFELGLPEAATSGQALSAAVAFVQPELRHHRGDQDSGSPDLPDATSELLNALRYSPRDEGRLDRFALRVLMNR